MSCIQCIDNINLPGAPEYGKSLRPTVNRGCNCGCGGTPIGPLEGEVPALLGKTVTRESRRWERPTSDPQVTLLVN